MALFPKAGTVVGIKNPLVGGGRALRLRLPTDEQYAALMRRVREVESKEGLAVADDLVTELSTEPVLLGEGEADYLLGRMVRLNVEPAKLSAGVDRVEMKATTALGNVPVQFTLRMPSLNRLREVGDELTLAEAVKLFDEHLAASSGYVGLVPNYHKLSVAVELRASAWRLADEGEEVDFFDSAPTGDGRGAAPAAA